MQHPFFELDVFSTGPFSGNPLAVIAEADGLTTEQMQAIAAWTNFSETTFLFTPTDPTADYRVRIFTPREEFPFAGHPTLGSATAWLAMGNEPKNPGNIVQECGVGLVTIRQDEELLSFATPPLLRSGPLDDATLEECLTELNLSREQVIDHAWGDNGPGWAILQLASAEEVRAISRTNSTHAKVGVVGLATATPQNPSATDESAAYEVRAFVPGFEDPVTGSLNGAVAQFMRQHDLVPATFSAVQGSQVGRAGKIHLHDDGQHLWVGGYTSVRVRGTLESA